MSRDEALGLARKGCSAQALRDAIAQRKRLGDPKSASIVHPDLTLRDALAILEHSVRKLADDHVLRGSREELIACNVLRECL